MMKRNEGFTLIELLCAIVAGSIVTAATATILLLGLRMNANASRMATQDNQVVIGLTVLENMVKNKALAQIETENTVETLADGSGGKTTIFRYDPSQKAIVAGSGAVLIENIEPTDCSMELKDGILTIKLTIDGTDHMKKICCRTGQIIYARK